MTKQKRKIIALVGLVGAGKSETAKILSQGSIPVIRFGQITNEEVAKRGQLLNEKTERNVREGLRKKFGMAAYAKLMVPKIKETLKTSDKLILDGLYSWEEYIYLKKKFSELILLAIVAAPSLRYYRIPKRKVRPFSPRMARKRDLAQLANLNKAGPILMADFVIENNGTKKELEAKVRRFWQDVN